MRFHDKTLEELDEIELALDERNTYFSYSEIIELYKEMYRRLKVLVRKKQKDENDLKYVINMVVYSLIKYGSYLKMEYEKDDYLAAKSLKEALSYDPENPIAAYRLGFLAYKDRNYQDSSQYFDRAIKNHKYYQGNKSYLLNEKQVANAHLYLTNSALYIAKKSFDQFTQLPKSNNEEIADYEFSPLFHKLRENEQYLESNAFYKVTKNGRTTCSKEECEILIKGVPLDTIVLYFSDRNIQLLFNEHNIELKPTYGDLLHYLLVKSSMKSPAVKSKVDRLFQNSDPTKVAVVTQTNYKKTISRLREKMADCDIPMVIQTTSNNRQTGYYFDGTIPFIVMYRVDEEMQYIT